MTDPVLGAATAIAKYLAPKIVTVLKEKIGTELKELKADLQHAFFNSFETYTNGMYERQSFFASIVFPNQQRKLKDFYLPLTFQYQAYDAAHEVLVNDYPGKLIADKKDLLIVDSAGMGKSTVMKFIFLRAIELGTGIPIFIELRKLNKTTSILDFIISQLRDLDQKLDKSLVLRLIDSGDFIFFLDGYDEISDADRSSVTTDLQDFKRRANRNYFIISSRDQVGLTSLPDFFRVTIKPLSFTEAIEIIKIYSAGNTVGSSLIERLSHPENKPIHEFLTNPLLVSLLFKAFEFKQTIPLKKHVFYRQVFEALFENHDLSKDGGEFNRSKLSSLDIHSFELVLRAIGFLSIQTTKVEYPKDELLRLIEDAKKLLTTIQFNPQALLQDLTTRVPLFVVDGNNYRWNHKSLQEYFAALHLSAEGYEFQEKVIGKMFWSERATAYINFFSLFSDIDPKGFRHVFIPKAINELINEFSKQIEPSEDISAEQIFDRFALTCFRHFVFVKLTHDEFENAKEARNHSFVFKEAFKALKSVGIDARGCGGGHSIAIETIVNYGTPRLSLFLQCSELTGMDFINFQVTKSDEPPPLKYKMAKDIKLTYPQGFTPLTNDRKSIFNNKDNYSVTNLYLAKDNPYIEFDIAKAKYLFNTINSELESAKSQQFNF